MRIACHAPAEKDQHAISKLLALKVHALTNAAANDQNTNIWAQYKV